MAAAFVIIALTLIGCGGGGGGASSDPEPTPRPDPGPSAAEMAAASKLLAQTTFGAPLEEIEAAADVGESAWIEQQFSLPVTQHLPIALRYLDAHGIDFTTPPFPSEYRRFAFFENAMLARDQLRQRVAYALSQIFVVSDRVNALRDSPVALAVYQDMLLEHAFGNFRDLLLAVTLNPSMGIYLSHVNNGKTDPDANTFPDENYAREVMQLFSIGLYELNADGSRRLDGAGNAIPTYDNDDIREFSKIFTGLSYGARDAGDTPFFGRRDPVLFVPMVMFDDFHEPGEKRLLNGTVVPAGQAGMADIEDAIDNLFEHPNVGPFIGRRLIQRLVTSNPSPAYVARVAAAFEGDATTPRGDMKTVLRAILLDPEARAMPGAGQTNTGKVREPFVRWLAVHRAIGTTTTDGTYPVPGYLAQDLLQQYVLSAPSVFNFYSPDYAPPGVVADAGLVSPELEIVTDSTVVGFANLMALTAFGNPSTPTREGFAQVSIDLADLRALADEPDRLLDRLDLLFTYGTLSEATRTSILAALRPLGADLNLRVRVALYLLLISPDFVVET